jgi:hypothetical protein
VNGAARMKMVSAAFDIFFQCLLFLYFTGKFVPEEAVLEMKANYSLPQDADQHIDEIMWIEMERDEAEKLVTA